MDTLLVEGLFHNPFKYNPEPVFPYSGNNQSRVNHDHELSYHDGNNLVVDDFLYLNDLNEGDIDIARSAGSNPHGDASESGDFSDACLKYMSEILMEENLEELCLRPLRIATLIKPDGVQRGLVGEIISRFEKGFTLRGLKLLNVERSFAEQHCADLSAKSFFNGLVDYIISGPVVAMVWEGKNVVVTGRTNIGATNPAESAPGTIRGDYAVEIGRNMIHGTIESARRLLFGSLMVLLTGRAVFTHGFASNYRSSIRSRGLLTKL